MQDGEFPMMTMRSMWISSLGGAVVLILLGLTGTQALASSCKGLENAKCTSLEGCYWVDPYQRKDGVEVSGHCRGKPSAKTPVTESSEPPKTEAAELQGDAKKTSTSSMTKD
jgi:hypothetical protein